MPVRLFDNHTSSIIEVTTNHRRRPYVKVKELPHDKLLILADDIYPGQILPTSFLNEVVFDFGNDDLVIGGDLCTDLEIDGWSLMSDSFFSGRALRIMHDEYVPGHYVVVDGYVPKYVAVVRVGAGFPYTGHIVGFDSIKEAETFVASGGGWVSVFAESALDKRYLTYAGRKELDLAPIKVDLHRTSQIGVERLDMFRFSERVRTLRMQEAGNG